MLRKTSHSFTHVIEELLSYHGVLRAVVRTSNPRINNPIPQSISKIASLFFGVDCELKGNNEEQRITHSALLHHHITSFIIVVLAGNKFSYSEE